MREAETMALTLDVFTFQHTSMNTHNFIIQITEEIEKLLENRDLEERSVAVGSFWFWKRPHFVHAKLCLRERVPQAQGSRGYPGVLACPKQSPCPGYILWVPRQGHGFSWPNLLCRPLVWDINKVAHVCKQGNPALEQKGPQQMEVFHAASEPPTQFSTSPHLSLVPPAGKCHPSFREMQEGWRDSPVTRPYPRLCLY